MNKTTALSFILFIVLISGFVSVNMIEYSNVIYKNEINVAHAAPDVPKREMRSQFKPKLTIMPEIETNPNFLFLSFKAAPERKNTLNPLKKYANKIIGINFEPTRYASVDAMPKMNSPICEIPKNTIPPKMQK